MRCYLKIPGGGAGPAKDVKRQLYKELGKLERTLGSVKLEGKHN